MKKKLSLLVLGAIGLFAGLVGVNAQTFSNGSKNYILDEIDTTCATQLNYEAIGVTKNGEPIYAEETSMDLLAQNGGSPLFNITNYVKVNKNAECVTLENQEFLDFVSETLSITFDMIDEENYAIQRLSIPFTAYTEYVLTEDTELDPNKSYLYYDAENDYYLYVNEDDLKVEDIGTYYEPVYYIRPTSTTIDSSLTYYELKSGKMEVVTNPTSENVVNYYLVYIEKSEEEYITKMADLNKNIVDTFISEKNIYNVVETKGVFYLVGEGTKGDEVSNVYTLDGNLVLENVFDFELLSNGLIVTTDENNKVDILNEKKKLIYSPSNVTQLYELLEKDEYNLILADDAKFYQLKEYSLIEGENQKYEDNDLTFRFSGDFALLDKVYLNDEELASENYTAEEGSTIITLKKDYLDTLKDGSYKLKVTYTDGGETTATFTVGELPKVPETFDGISKYLILGSISLIGLISTTVVLKKRYN